jgi:hypothetical protein
LLLKVGDYANNHVASACYLRAWAGDDGNLRRVFVGQLESAPKRPERAGFRRRLFGNVAVSREAERRLSIYESEGIDALRRIDADWPLDLHTKARIGALIAVHMVRNPAVLETTSQLLGKQIIKKLPEYERELSPDKVSELVRGLTSNEFRISHMLETIPKTASFVASMHWTLLDFRSPLLATGDQPVTAVPLLGDGGRAEVAPMPSTGYTATSELRIALSPSRALLLTWQNDEDAERPLLVDDAVAVELNRAVIAQADREWFHHPDRRPVRITVDDFDLENCRSVGHLLVPGYSDEAAAASPRRAHTCELLEGMIENNVLDAYHVGGVRREPI